MAAGDTSLEIQASHFVSIPVHFITKLGYISELNSCINSNEALGVNLCGHMFLRRTVRYSINT
jgi:hypothetical protein